MPQPQFINSILTLGVKQTKLHATKYLNVLFKSSHTHNHTLYKLETDLWFYQFIEITLYKLCIVATDVDNEFEMSF